MLDFLYIIVGVTDVIFKTDSISVSHAYLDPANAKITTASLVAGTHLKLHSTATVYYPLPYIKMREMKKRKKEKEKERNADAGFSAIHGTITT